MSVSLIIGDCRDVLRGLPAQSVQACVTSPPYYGLRDYKHDDQIGLEATPEAFVAELVAVFREVRRVLRDDGTLWLNLGDSYASRPNGSIGKEGSMEGAYTGHDEFRRVHALRKPGIPEGLKHKDLIGIPWMVAFALRADGWYLRQDIIWSKPNAMPESVGDRCTKAHEYMFLLSKGPRYYFDAEAISEPVASATVARLAQDVGEQAGSPLPGKATPMRAAASKYSFARAHKASAGDHGQKPQHRPARADVEYRDRRNKRSVWTVATAPYRGAHFATFPPALIEPCILAGSPRGGGDPRPFRRRRDHGPGGRAVGA